MAYLQRISTKKNTYFIYHVDTLFDSMIETIFLTLAGAPFKWRCGPSQRKSQKLFLRNLRTIWFVSFIVFLRMLLMNIIGQEPRSPYWPTRRVVLLQATEGSCLLCFRIFHATRNICCTAKPRQSWYLFWQVQQKWQVQASHHGSGLCCTIREIQSEATSIPLPLCLKFIAKI